MLTFWEIRRDGTPSSYLLGTCHVGITLDQALPKKYQKLIGQASVFVMEADLNNFEPQAAIRKFRLPHGETLSDLVGKQEWASIVEATDLGGAAKFLDRMHPSQLFAFLIERMTRNINTGAPSMDLAAYEIASDAYVQQEFLETVDEQIDSILEIPLEEWVRSLEELAQPDALDTLRTEIDSTLEICRTGELSIFEMWLEKARKEDPDGVSIIENQLLTLRNRKWIPKLDAFFRQGPAFVAVGVGHMVGEEGLLMLLEQKGYRVEQLQGDTPAANEPRASKSISWTH